MLIEDAIKSDFEVKLIAVGPVTKHANADSLSMTEVDGAVVIFKTGSFKEGDQAVYVPTDALVPTDKPAFEFLKHENRTHHRVKAVRLRGVFSLGLLIPPPPMVHALEMTLQEYFEIQKYIPPEERAQLEHGAKMAHMKNARKAKGPKLPVYGLDNIRKMSDVLQDGELVCITEKIHGCNFRAVYTGGRLWVGSHKVMRGCSRHRIAEWFNRQWLKLKSLLGVHHRAHTLETAGDIWWEQAEALNLKERLKGFPDMVLYGEVYGEKCQDLTYDSPQGRKFRAFDVYDLKAGRFLDYADFLNFITNIGLDVNEFTVPALKGCEPWSAEVYAKWKTFADTSKTTLGGKHCIEGVVIKPMVERNDPRCGRVGLKLVGERFLLSRKDE